MRRVLGLLMVVVTAAVAVDAAQEQKTGARRLSSGPKSWTARSAAGVTLMGTWTAVVDPQSGAAGGTWTLVDAQARTAAQGTWSAAKAPSGWSGAWRALRAGSTTEYAGSWSASVVNAAPDAPLATLFERALQGVVSGQWRAGGQSGAWSIRAFD